MYENLSETISNLKKILSDANCEHMNKASIKGYLGELIILKIFQDEGKLVTHEGNQSGSDLSVETGTGKIKIDVKTSTKKIEFEKAHGMPYHWSWALKTESKRKISCDWFICVALNERYEKYRIYCIKATDVDKFPEGVKRFKKVVRTFNISSNTIPSSVDSDVLRVFEGSMNLIKQKVAIEVEVGQSLSKMLNI